MSTLLLKYNKQSTERLVQSGLVGLIYQDKLKDRI